jgi:hypothetical protein
MGLVQDSRVQDSWAEQPRQKSWVRRPGQVILDRSALDMTVGTSEIGQASMDRSIWTCKPGQGRRESKVGTEQPGEANQNLKFKG